MLGLLEEYLRGARESSLFPKLSTSKAGLIREQAPVLS